MKKYSLMVCMRVSAKNAEELELLSTKLKDQLEQLQIGRAHV